MPELPVLALAVLVIAALAAGLWLALHLNALAALFAGNADIVPSRRPPRASPAQVYTALAIFNLGWVGSIIIWLGVIASRT